MITIYYFAYLASLIGGAALAMALNYLFDKSRKIDDFTFGYASGIVIAALWVLAFR